jgi:transcription initiation factor TFIIIB Brf1 subunit/transcription initiation factor TFIIB
MTIYSVKINKHQTVKTTSLNEARSLAKQALADKVAFEKSFIEKLNSADPIPFHPYLSSVSEKMYIRGNEIEYCIYASIHIARERRKTYRTTIKAENATQGGYDFNLHSEIAKRIEQREHFNKEEQEKTI